jgi:cytohesin
MVFAGIALPSFGRGTGDNSAEKSAGTAPLSQEEKDRALLNAIESGDIVRIRALLDDGANPNGSGLSVPLVRAAEKNFVEGAALLLERGADPDARDKYGWTAAHHAAEWSNETMLRLLAGHGARLDMAADSGSTPLFLPVKHHSRFKSEVFRFILAWEREKRPDFSGAFSRRKDYIASLFSQAIPPDMLEALLEAGEELDGDGGGGKRPAFYAAAASGENGLAVTRRLMEAGVRFDFTTEKGSSPLLAAAIDTRRKKTFFAILDWEQKHSPDFSGGETSRSAYLSRAVFAFCYDKGNEDAMAALFEAGADLSAFVSPDENGEPVFVPNMYDSLPYAPLLIAQGMPADIRNSRGKTFLMGAASLVHEDLARTLLEAGADPNAADRQGRTALMEAFSPEVIRLLLDYGADPKALDHDGKSVLHQAHPGRDETLRMLVEAGAWVDRPDNEGETPLMRAVWLYRRSNMPEQDMRAIRELIELGADPA